MNQRGEPPCGVVQSQHWGGGAELWSVLDVPFPFNPVNKRPGRGPRAANRECKSDASSTLLVSPRSGRPSAHRTGGGETCSGEHVPQPAATVVFHLRRVEGVGFATENPVQECLRSRWCINNGQRMGSACTVCQLTLLALYLQPT